MLQVGLPSTSVFFYSFTHPHQCDLVEDELSVTELNWSKFCRNEVAFKKKASDQHQSNVASAALAWLGLVHHPSLSSCCCCLPHGPVRITQYEIRFISTAFDIYIPYTGDAVPYMVIDVDAEAVRDRVKYARTNTSFILLILSLRSVVSLLMSFLVASDMVVSYILTVSCSFEDRTFLLAS